MIARNPCKLLPPVPAPDSGPAGTGGCASGATLAQAQAAVATRVAGAMQDILQITERTTVGTKQTAESIGELADLAVELNRQGTARSGHNHHRSTVGADGQKVKVVSDDAKELNESLAILEKDAAANAKLKSDMQGLKTWWDDKAKERSANDKAKVDEAALKKAGAVAIVKFGGGVQVVMGTLSDNIESEMRRQMKR